MQSFNPWLVFCSFCCVGPLVFGFICVRLGISIGRRGMPTLQSPLAFRRYASKPTGERVRELVQEPQRNVRA